MKKQKLIKIIIPICIVLVIGGIWIFKNSMPVEGSDFTAEHEDFELHASNINLEQLLVHELPMIIDFGATECIPCKEMAPVLSLLNEEMQGEAIIKFVDVWVNVGGATGFPVSVIPTQILVNSDGTPYIPSKDLGIEFIYYSDQNTSEHVFTAHQGGLTEEQMRLILADMGAL